MFTENEKKILKMLLTAFGEEYSINQIAKQCKISPNGALKILQKFEKENLLNYKKIANIKSYRLNLDNEKTNAILELSLYPELNNRMKFRYDDLKPLKNLTEAMILFGSYIDLKKEPNDLDLLILLKKEDFKEYKEQSKKIYQTMPIKVHEIMQTEEDIKKNLLNKDKIIIDALRKGIILWGNKKIIELIENGY